MTRQSNFFEEAPYQRHSDTSRAAAEDIEQSMGRLQARVYAFLAQNGPATDEMMQSALGMNPSTQRPRRIELLGKGLVCDSGRRALTKSRRHAFLWAVRPKI